MSADRVKIPYTGPLLSSDAVLVGLIVTPTDDAAYQSYNFEFAGVDRSATFGIHVSRHHATRFIKAFQAGALIRTTSLETDNGGKTYVEFRLPVLGRYMNADLKRLGF